MRQLIITLALCLASLIAQSQTVEVTGKLKVSDMDTSDTENLLVVKQADGTLATRQMATLPPPTSDSTRSMVSDLALTSVLCSCPNLAPEMIQTLLNNGYTIESLFGFGVTISDLLASGLTINELVDAGLPAANLLDTDMWSPLYLFNLGVPLDSLHGQTYHGGLIFYLDTSDIYPFEGLLSAPSDQDSDAEWGCTSHDVAGANNIWVGTGAQNTIAIVTDGCASSGEAAIICANLDLNGYADWFLPSKDELNLMWENLADSDGDNNNTGPGDPNNLGGFESQGYLSSSEFDTNTAWAQLFNTGSQALAPKDLSSHVRAARAF